MSLLQQFIRFGVSGAFVTGVSVSVYAFLSAVGIRPISANLVAYAVSMLVGYVLHSRWSFAGIGQSDPVTGIRFLAASLMTLGLNSFWVWALVDIWGSDPWRAAIPMIFITPLFSFWFNRRFVFGAA